MTSMLEKAFFEAAKVPDVEQNALARWVLDEIESDRKWDTLFAESEDTLAQLASEALEEEEQGKTTRLDVDKKRTKSKTPFDIEGIVNTRATTQDILDATSKSRQGSA